MMKGAGHAELEQNGEEWRREARKAEQEAKERRGEDEGRKPWELPKRCYQKTIKT